jgi:hypothetical protein
MSYRLYTFVNFYLSDIQRGIQSAHLVHDMFINWTGVSVNEEPTTWYLEKIKRRNALIEWAALHKTMIVCNGGNSQDLDQLFTELSHWQRLEREYHLPFDSFYEDGPSLNHALTCVGVVLPEDLYDATVEPYGSQGDAPMTRVTLANDEMEPIIYTERGPVDITRLDDPLEVRARMVKKLKSYRLA